MPTPGAGSTAFSRKGTGNEHTTGIVAGRLVAGWMGAERVVAMSRHESRQKLATHFGATHVVVARGEEGEAAVMDLTDVYMTIFVPATQAGRLTINEEARVVVDAVPEYVFPATVSFVSPESQFTPKSVETQSEREQLYFRVKLQAPLSLLQGMEERVKTGLRGMGYVRVDPAVAWPAWAAPLLPPASPHAARAP